MTRAAYPIKHASPKVGCFCAACEGWRNGCWEALSPPQRRALSHLSRIVPRHPDDLQDHHSVNRRTLNSLSRSVSGHRPALTMQLDLRRPLYDASYYTFFVLTADGADLLAVERAA